MFFISLPKARMNKKKILIPETKQKEKEKNFRLAISAFSVFVLLVSITKLCECGKQWEN